jgi:predicted PhzF superfamily epimerase YddE/YHI9
MQAIAAENNLSETAFTVPRADDEADYELRWFTPTTEVALCGHATLASGHVLIGDTGRVRFRTRKAGVLEVRSAAGGSYELDLPLTLVAPADDEQLLAAASRDRAGLLQALGIGDGFPEPVYADADGALRVGVVSRETAGSAPAAHSRVVVGQDIAGGEGAAQGAEIFLSYQGSEAVAIVLVEDEEAVRACAPDMRKLGEIDLMVIVTAPGSGGYDVASRVFVPAWGVDEDPVTGSAHAALTPFWCERLGRESFSAWQASRRGGAVACRLVGDRAVLGGNCVTVIEGVLTI